jgi:hypothetical protein
MNLTLSVDDDLLARARARAELRGMSLDQMILEYLEEVASDLSSEELLAELNASWEESTGDSAGRKWTREELHERSNPR